MKRYKVLNIKGALLDKQQLEKYLEKIASDHILKAKSDKDTYPIPRLKENFEIITEVYHLLNEHIKLNISIHPAGEWILDNYYAIEETVKMIEKEMSLKKYRNFLAIGNGAYKGFARIYVLATEIVAYSDSKIEPKNLVDDLRAYQEKKNLSMEEIWNLGIFIQIALIENIRGICESIYSSQLQKYKVENIIERLVENKSKEELQFKNIKEYRSKVNNMRYAFIEYMSYKLRKYGKKAYPFLNILEEQVGKMGTDISDIIQKEHFDIASKRVLMGNCITSIKTLQRINLIEIFENINKVDDILKNDPAHVYEKMDYKTKIYYRNTIETLSKKTKISEIYIAKKSLELAQREQKEKIKEQLNKKNINENDIEKEVQKQKHIGYYLIDDGKKQLMEILYNKKKFILTANQKMWLWIILKKGISITISVLLGIFLYKQIHNALLSIIITLFIYIPIEEMVIQILQYLLGKIVKPKQIPKLDFSNGIPKEESTFVVIPTIIDNEEKVKELMKKLEVYYLANKSENIYFALLGDCSSSDKEKENQDEKVIKIGKEWAKKLNNKYVAQDFPKFHFLYRKRTWNEKENCFLGWERKRGLLNQFNEYILENQKNEFRENSIEEYKQKGKIPKIKYIITLDSDTELVLNTGLELIGAMAHILNQPILNSQKNKVVQGYGIMQPRVGINLESARKTLFTKIYAGSGGTDSYTTAISDIYQDNFGEGIFAGKGIYNLEIFSTVLKDQIPENTVLSHDLLEGNYLRCGYVSDILLMDGYPTNYNSFKNRLHRWTRGDWQIIGWLGSKKGKNPLDTISKYKIIDNLIRSLFIPMILLSFITIILIDYFYTITIWPIISILLISLVIPSILEIVNKIVYKKNGETFQKTFDKQISSFEGSIIRGILEIATLPDKAYMNINAITKTIYRMYVSKKHLLEWTTAEEAERKSKNTLISYYKDMIPNIILGLLSLIFSNFYNNVISILLFILGIIWLITPVIEYNIGKSIQNRKPIDKLTEKEKEYITEIAKRTWQFFKENLNEKSNFLPPDNYQENRNPKVVYRTSPTNIGLALLAVVSSYDLGFETLENTIDLLEKMLNTIQQLAKWNGHLYNWYNIETLEPLMPKYISTVDSGNFIGYLYVLKQFLENTKEEKNVEIVEKSSSKDIKIADNETKILNKIENMIEIINIIIQNTKFEHLYVAENKIFSIGYNVEENSLTPSYYDLLASEARQASFVAIAKRDIPAKHWYALSRSLTELNKYKGLISWSGTAFEYLMPNINIPGPEGSLLSESIKFAIMSQKQYSKKLNIPWGISEAAFHLKDLNNNYQYKAFGIPWLGIKRGLADEIVVSSYGSIMALSEDPKNVIQNLKVLEEQGMFGQYGFYESIDYTPNRLRRNEKNAIVKTYMAHHQGLILLSINNLLKEQILQKRFMKNPEIKAIDILLQEKMPENIIITKEHKEKVEKMKTIDYDAYSQREYTKINEKINPINVISNENYTVVIDQKGKGYSKYKNIIINRYKETDEEEQGIFFYLRNIKTKKIWTSCYMNYLPKPNKYHITYTPDQDKFTRMDDNIETTTKIAVMPNKPIEIRQIELKNHGMTEETIEITSFLEPVLSTFEQDYAHKAFNNLFLNYEMVDDILLIKRNKRNKGEKETYLAINLYTENETIGELEYEIDKEKFIGRGNLLLPKTIQKGLPMGRRIGITTDPIVAMRRTINILPEKTIKLNLILAVAEEKEEALKMIYENQNSEKIERNMDLAKAKVEAENMYLGIKGKEIETYQKMLSYLIYQNPLKTLKNTENKVEKAPTSELWKYGISGDIPMLVIKIKEVNDIDIVKEAIKAHEYFRIKNIPVDLIIINEEKKNYENYVQEEIQNAILDKNVTYLQNQKGGIFILNHIDKNSQNIIEYRANLLIDSSLGEIDRQLKDQEEEYLDKIKRTAKQNEKTDNIESEVNRQALDDKNLKYYNEYGGFTNDGKEYVIRTNKDERLPTVWSNVLANEKFGTVVTETMGGYTWYQNSRLNRLTAWNNNQVTDVPSEIIYLKDLKNQKTWSLGLNPMPDDNDYYITYGFGYCKYQHTCDGIVQKLEMYVPRKDSIKVQILHLENLQTQRKELKLIYYVKTVLDEDEIKSNGHLQIEYKSNSNLITIENKIDKENKTILYLSSSEKIQSYTGNKRDFIGIGTISNPEALEELELDRQNSLGKENIVAIEIKITLEALENKDIVLVLGADQNILACQDKAYEYTNVNNAITEYEKEKKYWQNKIETLQVATPLESTNIILNGWLLYQTLCSRIYARSGYYQSGGAYGFRDQLQDCICLKYIDIELVKNQIIKHSKHQFIEGDVEHWWHEETSRGIRTRFSDDLLWLPYMVSEYIEFTGDNTILEEETTYLQGEVLPEGVDEKYDLYLPSEKKESIYEHCKKAIEKAFSLGENRLPKIGSGDWNDGFSTVGNKGKGESVWLGFFLYTVLNRFIPICEAKEEKETVEKYRAMMETLKRALNTAGWDGRWYKRAFMDNGDILGSIQNEECRIDSIAQSWATISGAGDNDKKYISIESLENHLVDKENGMIKLLDPPFEKSKLEPGYIKAYLPGTRENGGQYTHSAIWVIIAEAILGFGEKANEFFRMINPIEHTRTKEEANKYKVEPYVVSADIYGMGNLTGRGGWTWYTGSSSWYYEAGIKYILGLRIEKGILKLQPCVPSNWQEYSIQYKYGESIYNIKVTNPNRKNTGVEKFWVNGEEVKEKRIKLNSSGEVYQIVVQI